MNPDTQRYEEILQEGSDLTAAQKRVQVRKTAQQALLYLHDIIAKQNQRYYTGNESGGKLPGLTTDSYDDWQRYDASLDAAEGATVDEQGSRWRSGYRNIIPIEKDDQYKDGISPLVSLGTGLTKFFTFDLTSAQQAALSPKIRLFKVEYEVAPDGKVALPFKEKAKREIIFEKAITTDEITILKDRGGNLGSSGIESFEWALKGVNPAEIDSNIEASLKVYFNNVGVFQDRLDKLADVATATQIATAAATAHAAAAADGISPAALTTAAAVPAAAAGVIAATAAVSEKAHFMDLITFAPPTTTTTSQLPCLEEYQPHFFEVMAEVGWDIADEGLKGLFTSKQREYVRKQTVKLYLTLSDHKFDFKEDGSATLTVNYRARQTFSDARYDILNPPAELVAAVDLAKKLDTETDGAVSSTRQKQQKRVSQEIGELSTRHYKKIVAALMAQLYEAEIPRDLLLNGSVRWTQHYQRNEDWGEDLEDAAYNVSTIGYKELLELMALAHEADNWDAPRGRYAISDAVESIQQIMAARSQVTARRVVDRDVLESIAKKVADPERTLLKDKSVGDDGADITNKTPDHKIYYFYLGDILEVFLETPPIVSDLRDRKLAFALTNFAYLNTLKLIEATRSDEENNLHLSTGPTDSLQKFQFSALKCSEKSLSSGQLKQFYTDLNLANVPIEAAAFLDFFTDRVISQNRVHYYLNNFLADMFTTLIKPLLGTTSVLGLPANQPALVNIDISAVDTKRTPLFMDNNKLGVNKPRDGLYPDGSTRRSRRILLGLDEDENQFTYIATLDEYLLASKPIFAQNPPSSGVNNSGTVKVIGINTGLRGATGAYEENVTAGIANFIVGLDRGLIKAVSFERVDQPYLREARVAREKSFGVGQLRELYHVSLTLYGNNLLKPGQMIYVEPNRLIFGSPASKKSVARVLGLGGYHLVVDVSNTIGVDGWETTVKALHMAMPAIPD